VKVEGLILVFIAIFFAIIGTIYWFLAYEWSGFTMLGGTVLLGLLPGGYYLWWSTRMKPRPEDLPDATIEDGAGVVGSFPSSSIWPFVLGSGLFLTALSAAFGFWLAAPGLALVVSAAVGYTVESRRGGLV
jgi:hypothetical protein